MIILNPNEKLTHVTEPCNSIHDFNFFIIKGPIRGVKLETKRSSVLIKRHPFLSSPCKEKLPNFPFVLTTDSTITMPVHTRRRSLYPKNSMAIDTMIDSMAIDTMIESTSDMPTSPRNLKRIRTPPENEPMIPTWDFATSPLVRKSMKQNDIWEGENKAVKWMNERICAVNLARKRRKKSTNYNEMEPNMLDILPDDLIIDIMGKLSVSANSASDIWNARLA